MLKVIVKNITSALSDPWVQGIFGLMLLARATDGMTRQLTELQGAIQQTQDFASKVQRDWMMRQRPSAPEPEANSQSSHEPSNAVKVTEYSSHDGRTE